MRGRSCFPRSGHWNLLQFLICSAADANTNWDAYSSTSHGKYTIYMCYPMVAVVIAATFNSQGFNTASRTILIKHRTSFPNSRLSDPRTKTVDVVGVGVGMGMGMSIGFQVACLLRTYYQGWSGALQSSDLP